VQTAYGPVNIKIARLGDAEKASPEFEDCRRAAETHRVPLRMVYEAAVVAFNTL
jgi:uncharacterized protein (DUF111 family)